MDISKTALNWFLMRFKIKRPVLLYQDALKTPFLLYRDALKTRF